MGIFLKLAKWLKVAALSMICSAEQELKSRVVNYAMPRGSAWFDAGTPKSLLAASQYVATTDMYQGLKISAPEEIALFKGYITRSQFEQQIASVKSCEYTEYLRGIAHEA